MLEKVLINQVLQLVVYICMMNMWVVSAEEEQVLRKDLYISLININTSAVLSDRTYVDVNMSWLMNEFKNDYSKFVADSSFIKKHSDCENVRLFCALAQMKTQKNIAIGEIWISKGQKKQAYVICYSKGQCYFVDVNKFEKKDISKEELKKCTFLRM